MSHEDDLPGSLGRSPNRIFPLALSPLLPFHTVVALALRAPQEVGGRAPYAAPTRSTTLLRRAGTPPANHPSPYTGSSPAHSRASSQQEHAAPASPQASNSWDRLLRGAEAAEKFNPNKESAEVTSKLKGKRLAQGQASSGASATPSNSWDRLLRGAEAAEQFNLHRDSAEVSSRLKEQHGVGSSGTSKQPEPGPVIRYNQDGSVRQRPGPKIGARYNLDGSLRRRPGARPGVPYKLDGSLRQKTGPRVGSTINLDGTPRKFPQPRGPQGPLKLDGTPRRRPGPAPGTTKGRKAWNAGLSQKGSLQN